MELATLLTAFAALLTSIITMFTVKEMKKQRLVSHLPIIKVLGSYAEVEINKSKNWLWESEKLNINNFGKGVALDVKVQWEVKLNDIITLLQKYDPHNIKGFSLEKNFLKLENSFHAIKIQSEKLFPAIPENTHTSNEIKIPSYLTAAFGTYINEAVLNRPKESKSQSYDLDDFPSVNIKVSYLDLNNNEYEKNFCLSISISSVANSSDNKNGNADVGFSISEVSA